MTIFFGGDVDVREAGESAVSLGRCVFPTARCRREAVSGMSHIFGPGGSEAYAQETWRSVKGDSGAVSDLCSGTPQTILDSCWPSGRTCLLTMYSPEIILACRLAVAARTATSCSSHLFRKPLDQTIVPPRS